MKVLFLDIDGVLNEAEGIAKMFEDKVSLLVEIVSKTDCKIVVSSSWRWGGLEEGSHFHEELARTDKTGLIFKSVIGRTPFNHECDPPLPKDFVRGHEIARWIEDHDYDGKFVILDDYDDMGPVQHRLVQTNGEFGMTEKDAHAAIELLMEK